MTSEAHTLIRTCNVFLRELGKVELLIKTEYVWHTLEGGQSCDVRNVFAHINNKWMKFQVPPDDLIDELCKEIYSSHDARRKS